jgi:hypothetical protein
MTARRPCPLPPSTCAQCLAWGSFRRPRICPACDSFGRVHSTGICAACHRALPLKKDFCRFCWAQASLEAKGQVGVLEPFLRKIEHHQLFLAGLHRSRTRIPKIGYPNGRYDQPLPTESPAPQRFTGWIQLKLPIDIRRDLTRFDHQQHADLTNPWLARARASAQFIAETRGWSRWVSSYVDRALVILLSTCDGDKIRHSELLPALRVHWLSAERTIEVLNAIDMFDDDQVPVFENWLRHNVADLAQGIRADVEHWLRTLRHGGPRSRARTPDTAWTYLRILRQP